MRLKQLVIKNFRKIADLTINFPAGLTVIVGENNAGKTAIIDALRLMLFAGRDYDAVRLNSDDFRRVSPECPIEISCTFCELDTKDEARLLECLVKVSDHDFHARLNFRATWNHKTGRASLRWWGGETEGGAFPQSIHDYISCVYLKPLRDPENGLRPGQNSQVSRLIRTLTPNEGEKDFVNLAKKANLEIAGLDSVTKAKEAINTQMAGIAGGEMAQKTRLIFNDPTFERIIAGIQPEIDGMPFSLNGLGFNNLIFTATTLSTLKQNAEFSYRSILVEEPEAHLHPQLQTLLLRYLSTVAGKADGEPQVQVIATSHSPVLASQASVDSIVSIHGRESGEVNAVSVHELHLPEKAKNKLRRYLDATKAELFFAKRILMVEGVAEALLLPAFAKILKCDLKDAAVTVINADGLNFDAFIPLFQGTGLQIPVAVLTDGDKKVGEDELSPSLKTIEDAAAKTKTVKVFHSEVTFEHELALDAGMLELMILSLKALHPRVAAGIETHLATLSDQKAKADYFYQEVFVERENILKGSFAQELAQQIEDDSKSSPTVPKYIRDALNYLGVTL